MLERIKFLVRRKIIRFGLTTVKKVEKPIKWGVVGTGSMSTIIATTLAYSKDSKLEAVSSRFIDKARKFAKSYGKCYYYDSYKKMVSDPKVNIDIVYVAIPVEQHYHVIKECLIACKNVVCEKPITVKIEEFNELIELAEKKKCFLMEGMWMKCLPTFRKALEWIQKDRIGTLQLIKVNFNKQKVVSELHNQKYFKVEGGVLQDYGIYGIAFMTTFLKGIPDKLDFSSRIDDKGIDTDWSIIAQKNKTKAFVNISSNFNSQSKASISGSDGTIEWESQFNRTNKIVLFDKNGLQQEKCVFSYNFNGYEFEVDEINNCVRDKLNQSSLVPWSESADAIAVLDFLLKNKNSSSA